MKPPSRTGNDFFSATASPEDVVAALILLYNRDKTVYTFTEYDADLLSKVAERVEGTGEITERQLSLIRSKLVKYRSILQDADLIHYRVRHLQVQSILSKTTEISSNMSCSVYRDDYIRLNFGFDESLINKIKAISERKYHSGGGERFWTVPRTLLNIRAVMNMGFTLPRELMAQLTTDSFEFNFEGLKKQLRPYQLQGATRIAGEMSVRALLADSMGLGKTPQALAVLWARWEDCLPALVVCPSVVKWNWAREANMWIDGLTVRVIEGYSKRTAYRTRENELAIINFDILADRGDKLGWASLLKNAGYKTIIIDECQKIKNWKSKRTQAITELAKEIPYVMALSGTPIESRPIEFYPALSIIKPSLFPNFWSFANRYCGESGNFNGHSNTQELNDILVNTIMIRRLKQDVLKELPSKVRSVIPVSIDMKEYQKAENALLSYIAQLEGRVSGGDGALAEIERLKQAAVLGKMKQAIEWIEDYLETDRKLVVFATHTFVLDMLEKHFKDIVVRVDGGTPDKKRMLNVDLFQGDDSIRLFIGNLKAAGVGITLTAASDTLTLEFGWTPGGHDQAEDRVHRIGQEADSVTAYYIIAKGTIEEELAEMLDQKRDILSQILDGKPAKDFEMFTKLMKHYMNKAAQLTLLR